MHDEKIEDIYCTLTGVMQDEFCVPGVENLFTEGSLCANLYAQMLDAYERLCERLGVKDEDGDVEIIINSLMTIEQNVSKKMFEYGVKFASNNDMD